MIFASSALAVEFMSPFTFASESGILDSSCCKTSFRLTFLPAKDAVSSCCNNLLSALIVFFSFCFPAKVILQSEANVFDFTFGSGSKNGSGRSSSWRLSKSSLSHIGGTRLLNRVCRTAEIRDEGYTSRMQTRTLRYTSRYCRGNTRPSTGRRFRGGT